MLKKLPGKHIGSKRVAVGVGVGGDDCSGGGAADFLDDNVQS